MQHIQQVLHIGYVQRQVGEQHGNAGNDLRHYHGNQQRNNQRRNNIGNQDRKPAQLGVLFHHIPLHRAHNAVQHIGDYNAAGKRGHNIQELGNAAGKHIQVPQHQVQRNADGNDRQPVKNRFRFFVHPNMVVLLIHTHSPDIRGSASLQKLFCPYLTATGGTNSYSLIVTSNGGLFKGKNLNIMQTVW